MLRSPGHGPVVKSSIVMFREFSAMNPELKRVEHSGRRWRAEQASGRPDRGSLGPEPLIVSPHHTRDQRLAQVELRILYLIHEPPRVGGIVGRNNSWETGSVRDAWLDGPVPGSILEFEPRRVDSYGVAAVVDGRDDHSPCKLRTDADHPVSQLDL